MYQQPQSYADMFAQAKAELFKQVDQYFNHKVKEYEEIEAALTKLKENV